MSHRLSSSHWLSSGTAGHLDRCKWDGWYHATPIRPSGAGAGRCDEVMSGPTNGKGSFTACAPGAPQQAGQRGSELVGGRAEDDAIGRSR